MLKILITMYVLIAFITKRLFSTFIRSLVFEMIFSKTPKASIVGLFKKWPIGIFFSHVYLFLFSLQ